MTEQDTIPTAILIQKNKNKGQKYIRLKLIPKEVFFSAPFFPEIWQA